MDNSEAIAILRGMRQLAQGYHDQPGRIATRATRASAGVVYQRRIDALDLAIRALQDQEGQPAND